MHKGLLRVITTRLLSADDVGFLSKHLDVNQYRGFISEMYNYRYSVNAIFTGWGNETCLGYDIVDGVAKAKYGMPEPELMQRVCHHDLAYLRSARTICTFLVRHRDQTDSDKSFFNWLFGPDSPYQDIFDHIVVHKDEKGNFISFICTDMQNVPLLLFTNLSIMTRLVTQFSYSPAFMRLVEAGLTETAAAFWVHQLQIVSPASNIRAISPRYGDIPIYYTSGASLAIFAKRDFSKLPAASSEKVKWTIKSNNVPNNPCNFIWDDPVFNAGSSTHSTRRLNFLRDIVTVFNDKDFKETAVKILNYTGEDWHNTIFSETEKAIKAITAREKKK